MRAETRKTPSIADALPQEIPLPLQPVKDELPTMATQPDESVKPPHKHPFGAITKHIGNDEQGRPVYVQEPGPAAGYIFNCKGCMWEDRQRLRETPNLPDLETVLFLVPRVEYDEKIAREFIGRRYPDAIHIGSAFNPERLIYVPNSRIVVITRRALPFKNTGPRYKRRQDEEGKWVEWEVEPEQYLSEIVESAPIVVADCIHVDQGTMFSDQKLDLSGLIARLAEVAFPYKITVPGHPDDKLYYMRLNT